MSDDGMWYLVTPREQEDMAARLRAISTDPQVQQTMFKFLLEFTPGRRTYCGGLAVSIYLAAAEYRTVTSRAIEEAWLSQHIEALVAAMVEEVDLQTEILRLYRRDRATRFGQLD
jgi:hypothetical protein